MSENQYDVSVCIPYAEDWPDLYFTLNGLAVNLVHSKLTHELIVTANNVSDRTAKCPKCTNRFVLPKDSNAITDAAKLMLARDFAAAHHSKLLISDIASNGVAANLAAAEAKGKYLCFTDSHVITFPNIFTECIKVMEENPDAGLVHAPITWTGLPYTKDFGFAHNKRCYQYLYRTYQNDNPEWYLYQAFHGAYNHTLVSEKPYPILGCGHGFYMIRREVWEKLGGYHTGQKAYGGRESFMTFKSWMFGYRNFTVPTTSHIHSICRRKYYWCNDWYIGNTLQQAYSIGGEKWLDIVYDRILRKPGHKKDVMERLRNEAVASSINERKFVLENQKFSFDEVLEKCAKDKVFH